jgi:ATP-binding cassette subfamily C protein PrsD
VVEWLPTQIWDPPFLILMSLSTLLIIGVAGLILYRASARRHNADMEAETESLRSRQLASAARVSPRSELAQALASCKSAFVSTALFSGMSNVLMLTGAFFMLQVYDRVLPSRSVPTLVALAILVAVLFAFLAILDMIRSRMLVRIGASLDDALSARVYDTIVRLPLMRSRGEGLQPLRDLDAVRGFLSGPGPTALFDLPWMPLYIGIVASFHIALGIAATIGALILITLTLLTEALARRPMRATADFAQTRNGLAETSRRNAEVLTAMGMTSRMNARWSEANQSYLASHQRVSDVAGGFGSVSKALRMLLQSTMLGIGAYLVINEAATAGIMIAAAILVARALAPVDLAISNWKGFVAARQGWKRLNQLLGAVPADRTPMTLPAPTESLVVEHATAVPPGQKKIVVQDVSFTLKSGQGLGIIGPSGSGKSSLVRLIVGAWYPARGRIRLDGAALDQWPREALGDHIGYLPQDVELFSGTVAENIARFESEALSEDIIGAARAACVHELIVALPQGYETEIGEQGQVLSAGQRQRVALARALYGEPLLVVLDEPNSNLDSEGEAALTQAILGVRNRGGIVIVVAHRASALAGVDSVLVMAQGNAAALGPRDEVLSKVLGPSQAQRSPLSVVRNRGRKRHDSTATAAK